MCGIFGYIGSDEHSMLKALSGLKDLEYRGYDSWGVAVGTPRGIFSKKGTGKISDVDEGAYGKVKGVRTIGHTRWATHGGVSCANAHPHFNADKTIAVAHNGIIENYRELKEEIERAHGEPFVFRSKTDTEVIPHLISMYREGGKTLEQAFVSACRRLCGRYALVVLSAHTDYLLAARNGSPLVLGKGEGECFIASDIPAFLDYTNITLQMADGEYAKVTPQTVCFYDLKTSKPVRKKPEIISWCKEVATKAGEPHYMLKEILEQRTLLYNAPILGSNDVKKAVPIFKKAKQILFTGMGTAANMGLAGEYIFARIGKRPARLVYGSEFDAVLPFVNKDTLVCGITQSGETADLLEAFSSAKKKLAKIAGLINVRGSSAEREASAVIPVNAGPEKAVASTKAAATQLIMLFSLAYAIAGKQKQGEKILSEAAETIKRWLTRRLIASVLRIAKDIKNREHLFVIGKALNYPIALEAALKIKEVSYIHAEGFAAGELKHGTIALIEKGTPCVVLVPNDEYKADVLSAAEELKARGAFIVGVAPEKNTLFDRFIKVPDLGDVTSIPNMIIAQILAYHLAVLRGNDPDKPRNLAKSVTVK